MSTEPCGHEPRWLEIDTGRSIVAACRSCGSKMVRAEATRRSSAMRGKASCREWSGDRDWIGLLGEAAVARALRLPLRLLRKDDGVDFVLPIGGWPEGTCDVKTHDTRKGTEPAVFLEPGHKWADVIVLCASDGRSATPLVWATSRHILKQGSLRHVNGRDVRVLRASAFPNQFASLVSLRQPPMTGDELQALGRAIPWG